MCVCGAAAVAALVNEGIFFLCRLSFIHSVIWFIDINNRELDTEYEKKNCSFSRCAPFNRNMKSPFNAISFTFFCAFLVCVCALQKKLGFIHSDIL